MNCPVCGTEVNGNQFCPGCGANMSAFAGVSQDKVIINQTPEQQMAAGDDSVTQLIPENYMTSTGDDGVTQLIPENYMTSTGDDTATVMLDPNQVQQHMPNQQPVFTQAPAFNQQPYGQPVFGQAPMGGYQQSPVQSASFNGGGVSPTVSKVFSIASIAIMVALLITCIVFVIKPLFYITQSYMGGVATNEEIEEAVIAQDPDDYEAANSSARIFYGAVIVFVIIAALNAWSCFARINKNCQKSPVNKAVGAFAVGLIGVIIFVVLKNMLDEAIVDGIDFGGFTPEEAAKFNVYNLAYVLGLVSVVVNLVNIFTAVSAKKATR